MSSIFKAGEIRDANQFKNGLIPVPFNNGSLCRCFHANEDIDTKIIGIRGNFVRIYMIQGEKYRAIASKIVSNEAIGAANTSLSVVEVVAGVSYQYVYVATGTDPLISATTVPVGSEVTIKDTGHLAANEGTFIVLASEANKFTVANVNGVAESTETIGDLGSIIPHSSIPEDYVSVVF